MLLKMMKHGGKWDFLAIVFKMKGPTFGNSAMEFLGIVVENFYQEHFNRLVIPYSML